MVSEKHCPSSQENSWNGPPKVDLKGFFVCNWCRSQCPGSDECEDEIANGDLFPRKQKIECLGEYCDRPCELQSDSTLETEQLIVLIKYLGNYLNTFLVRDPNAVFRWKCQDCGHIHESKEPPF